MLLVPPQGSLGLIPLTQIRTVLSSTETETSIQVSLVTTYIYTSNSYEI